MPSVWIKLPIGKRYPPSAENVIYTVSKNCRSWGRAQTFWSRGSWYSCIYVHHVAGNQTALNYGHEEFYLVCQLASFFFLSLFHCCTESSRKAMKNWMAHLPSNLGDSWFRQIILSHVQLDQCLSSGPMSVVWSTSPENHCWEVNSDFALWNQPFNRS